MKFFEFLEVGLRWAWGTLLTAIATAVLTMFLKHGRRWFRPVQKFIRTGRVTDRNTRGRSRRCLPASSQAGTKVRMLTVARVLSRLALLTVKKRGGHAGPPQQVSPNGQNDTPLDLRF